MVNTNQEVIINYLQYRSTRDVLNNSHKLYIYDCSHSLLWYFYNKYQVGVNIVGVFK